MKLTKYFKLFESRSANLSKDEFCNGMTNGIVTAEHANDLFDMFINKIKN